MPCLIMCTKYNLIIYLFYLQRDFLRGDKVFVPARKQNVVLKIVSFELYAFKLFVCSFK